MTDVFKDLLDLMRVRSTAFVGKTLQAPWSILIEQQEPLARFHLVVAGQTWIGLPGRDDGVVLGKGDLAIIPQGLAHEYRDPGNTSPAEARFLPDFDNGPYFQTPKEGSDETCLLCGYFQISEQTPPTILSRLPELIVARGRAEGQRKYDLVVEMLRLELIDQSPTTQVALNRLTEILCVQALHDWLIEALEADEHLCALAEPKTKLVLDSIHADPAREWTVESLARLYGQSRTAFAEHFKKATGLTPIGYVRRWRIQLACTMLEQSRLTIDEIAFKAGYSDSNAFNRAFKRETGTSPGAFKRMLQG